jgi:hypothetical protein
MNSPHVLPFRPAKVRVVEISSYLDDAKPFLEVKRNPHPGQHNSGVDAPGCKKSTHSYKQVAFVEILTHLWT